MELIKAIGGYDSLGFAVLFLGTMFGGSALLAVLPKYYKLIGLAIFIFGAVLAMGMVSNTAVNGYEQTGENVYLYVPILFAFFIVVGVLRAMLKADNKENGEEKNGGKNA